MTLGCGTPQGAPSARPRKCQNDRKAATDAPDGAAVYQGQGTVSGTRIVVGPLGTPGATPAS